MLNEPVERKPLAKPRASHLHEDDPELEQEFRLLARILIDAYLAQPTRPVPSPQLDKEHPSPTLLSVKADSDIPTHNE